MRKNLNPQPTLSTGHAAVAKLTACKAHGCKAHGYTDCKAHGYTPWEDWSLQTKII